MLTVARRRDTALWVKLVGGLLALGLFILIVKWLFITAVILVVPFGAWWVWDRSQQAKARPATVHRSGGADPFRRREAESRAVIDAAGGCGWCGARVAHVDPATGRYVLPVDFHRREIDEEAAFDPY